MESKPNRRIKFIVIHHFKELSLYKMYDVMISSQIWEWCNVITMSKVMVIFLSFGHLTWYQFIERYSYNRRRLYLFKFDRYLISFLWNNYQTYTFFSKKNQLYHYITNTTIILLPNCIFYLTNNFLLYYLKTNLFIKNTIYFIYFIIISLFLIILTDKMLKNR